MKPDLLEILACPYCGGSLKIRPGRGSDAADIEFGILACGCSEYPVVGGIPIIKAEGRVNAMRQTVDSVLNIGPRVKDLVELVRAGSFEEALLQLLVIPKRRVGRLFALSEGAPARVAGKIRAVGDAFWRRQRKQNRDFLLDVRGEATAMEMIHFFYCASLQAEVYHYFSCRFGQPRHLAALSLASLLPAGPAPVLDLACGFGHIMHYWRAVHPNQKIVGVDRNFFQLYVARKWVAPGGEFICSEADVRLPFASQRFSSVFCSDAFHCFLRRLQCAEEIKRVTEPGGLMILARFGNSLVEPKEGYELSPQQYLSLFDGLATRLVSEGALLQTYLKGSGPLLRDSAPLEQVGRQKWLSLVATADPARLRDYGKFETWPHGVGRLKLNPLYRETGTDAKGDLTVEMQFPSSWYEFENNDCLQYMPKTAVLSREAVQALQTGAATDEIRQLVKRCVVIGVPERYL